MLVDPQVHLGALRRHVEGGDDLLVTLGAPAHAVLRKQRGRGPDRLQRRASGGGARGVLAAGAENVRASKEASLGGSGSVAEAVVTGRTPASVARAEGGHESGVSR